jgi:pyruvate/2-oxoglutarate dehydrogenase complex dihydrolipoamide dehydrogenase (E3) component
VLGSGASAVDLAGLLHGEGAEVSLLARADEVLFACLPRLRSVLERLSEPDCGIGTGWVMKACSDAPWLIRMLPVHLRRRLAKQPGPLGGAFMKKRVIDEVPLLVGRHVEAAEQRSGKVHLRVFSSGGATQTLNADHVVAATGYKVDIGRLSFLDPRLRAGIRCSDGAPVLSAAYEASVPGLHFIGPAAASSFGPVARFIFGAAHPAHRLAQRLSRQTHVHAVPSQATSRLNSPVLR